jgi:hypothetical protein
MLLALSLNLYGEWSKRESKELASPTTCPSLAKANVPMRKLHVPRFTQYPKGSIHIYTLWV